MIFTKNLDTLRHFYHELLGFPIIDDDPSFTQIDIGGVILSLHAGARPAGGGKRTPVEIGFFCDDVEATRKELISRGVKVGSVALFGDLRLCKGTDPDGNVFGISNRPLLRPSL